MCSCVHFKQKSKKTLNFINIISIRKEPRLADGELGYTKDT